MSGDRRATSYEIRVMLNYRILAVFLACATATACGLNPRSEDPSADEGPFVFNGNGGTSSGTGGSGTGETSTAVGGTSGSSSGGANFGTGGSGGSGGFGGGVPWADAGAVDASPDGTLEPDASDAATDSGDGADAEAGADDAGDASVDSG